MKMTTTEKRMVSAGDPDEIYDPPMIMGEFTEAPDVEAIARALIWSGIVPRIHNELSIKYLWKKSGGKKLGACAKPSGLTGYFAGCDFVIWLAYDHVIEKGLTRYQVEALVYHELLHVNYDYDSNDNLKPVLYDHEFEGFKEEIEFYGFWRENIEDIGKAFQKVLPGFGVTGEKRESSSRAAQRLINEAVADERPALDVDGGE